MSTVESPKDDGEKTNRWGVDNHVQFGNLGKKEKAVVLPFLRAWPFSVAFDTGLPQYLVHGFLRHRSCLG